MYHRSLNGNFAYIDNQNMYMATHKGEHPWDIDMRKLRVYLEEKYNVIQAYLFMGAFDLQRQNLYMMLQQCGYILVFREHGIGLKGRKKGNVDVDIVFQMMRDAYESAQIEKVVLLSGDGDYFRTVEHLIGMGKFEKLLVPSHKNASSLYKKLGDGAIAYLDDASMKKKIGKKCKK